MEKHQQVLIQLLSSAVRRQNVINIDCKSIDWNLIYEEAKAHEVHTLIYPVIQTLDSQYKINSDLMSKWNKDMLLSSMHQIQHIQQMSQVIAAFNQSNIPVIALKGLVLREFYPHPDLRSMSDADILVYTEDISRAKDLLISLGYFISSSDDKHIHLNHEIYLSVELHQSIISYERFSHVAHLEDSLWKNAIETKIHNVPVLTFSPEDQLLHICLHMASHFKSTGFGLRQLCDLVVFFEAHREIIAWDPFLAKCKSLQIDTFLQALFIICNKLFEMTIPDTTYKQGLENESYINLLIDDIFSAGVYGRKTKGRVVSNLQDHFSVNKKSEKFKDKLLNNLSLIFPPPKKLGQRYAYAKKNTILAPVAWGHRLAWGVIRKDLSHSDKRDFIYSTENTKSIRKERTKLLEWLQLR